MQIEYKNIFIDVKQGTTVAELLKEEIQKALLVNLIMKLKT